MRRLAAVFVATSLLLGGACLLEQRTVENPEILPIGCQVDANCVIGRVCNAGFCEEGCRDAADCPDGQECGPDHTCVGPGGEPPQTADTGSAPAPSADAG